MKDLMIEQIKAPERALVVMEVLEEQREKTQRADPLVVGPGNGKAPQWLAHSIAR